MDADWGEKAGTGPFTGVRIIEWGTNFSLPLATMALADQGADVIKLESPAGDGTRNATAHRTGVKGMAASFLVANRNKRSIVLDMKKPGAVEVVRKLVETADVFAQNFRPGVVERFGLGFEDLKQIKPDLIFVSVSGFGRTGPYSKQRVWDPVVQAVSGMMMSQADPDTGIPTQMKSSVADKVTALTVSQAISAALYHRAVTGRGQHVEVDMLSAALPFNWTSAMLNDIWLGEGVTPGANLKELRLVYRTKDDSFLVAIGISDDEWASLVTTIGRPDLVDDPRFKESFERLKNSKLVAEELAPVFLTRTAVEWLEILSHCDAVFAPVNGPGNIVENPQVVAQGLVTEAVHPVAGSYRQTAHPARFHGSPAQMRRHPPMLGEHSIELLEEAGIDADQIALLQSTKAVL